MKHNRPSELCVYSGVIAVVAHIIKETHNTPSAHKQVKPKTTICYNETYSTSVVSAGIPMFTVLLKTCESRPLLKGRFASGYSVSVTVSHQP